MKVTDPRDTDNTLELEVKVNFSGRPATYDDPAEGPELEIAHIYDDDFVKIPFTTFTQEQLEAIEKQMYENWEDDGDDEEDFYED